MYHRREHKTCEFAMHEAYAIDVIVSTGEGKVCEHSLVALLGNTSLQNFPFVISLDFIVLRLNLHGRFFPIIRLAIVLALAYTLTLD